MRVVSFIYFYKTWKKGFFFCTCWEAVVQIAKYAFKNNRVFAINMSACFVTELFADQFIDLLPYIDILFGNEEVIHQNLQLYEKNNN